ncbi:MULTISPECIES: sugar ABC transporter ATP-binding protein [Roseiflexus]|uniref:ABC transporter related n=1 Tax=Roseiflexus castenholzii (strain DSM 13941 / HLO8) TaxID=383372 RepID=A7NMH6_ROSCS|nr:MULTISPECIES: sugar ABC transporter ATP-binding protein [Roseiflexus]ABU58738.1 ABC transporter related [Roseiflexus castenholzii DSM 13941]GIW01716.1 MAG: sugar ABC transporter ATP-binding protein [Roseiflexus sp.]
MPSLLAVRNVAKRYGAIQALTDASLEISAGETLALIGANGSGKSTLSKVINGVVAPDGGQLLLDGRAVRFDSPHAAKDAGISTVFQELSLVPQMTVAENIWLTREPLRRGGLIDQRAERRRTEALLSLFAGTLRTDLTPDTPVSALLPDERQIVEILKAISVNPRLLILDEATASLDSRQVQRLFELIGQWKTQGTAIIFISHRMAEIEQIADRYSVLRNGQTVGEGSMKDATSSDLVALMTPETSGGAIERHRMLPDELATRRIVLQIDGLCTSVLRGVGIQVREGELLGIGGLKGQGQRDLLLAIFGGVPYSGRITLEGKTVHFTHPRQAMNHGVALVPGDRAGEGLLSIRSILENLLVPSWRHYGFPLRMKRARQDAGAIATRLDLKMAGLDAPVSSLSGGNAQKVVIGKWLLRNPRVLLLDDPTKGVDIAAKAEFYRLLSRLCAEGTTVILYSSDDEELIGLSDRVIVMHDGQISAELAGASLTTANLVAASLGVVARETL